MADCVECCNRYEKQARSEYAQQSLPLLHASGTSGSSSIVSRAMDPAIMGLVGLVADCVAWAAVRTQQSNGETWQFNQRLLSSNLPPTGSVLTKDVCTWCAKGNVFGQFSRFVARTEFEHPCSSASAYMYARGYTCSGLTKLCITCSQA